MRSGEQGFTLLEVLVALVISALLLAVIFDSAHVARDRMRRAALLDRSAILARSVMARLNASPYEATPVSQTEGELAWSAQQKEIEVDQRGQLGLVETDLVVRHGTAIMLTVSSLHLKRLA